MPNIFIQSGNLWKARFWIFGSSLRYALKWYYLLTISALKLYGRIRGDVECIFLTGSFAEGNPAYGISDIDFCIVIEDDADVAKRKVSIFKQIALLKKIFVFLESAHHVEILSLPQFLLFREYNAGYLFSLPGKSKSIYSKGGIKDIHIDYRREHEFQLLQFLWMKFVRLQEEPRNMEYYIYCGEKLVNALDQIIARLGMKYENEPEGEVCDYILGRFISILDALAVPLPRHSGAMHEGRFGSRPLTIPNYIFLESWNIGALLVRATSPSHLTVIVEEYKNENKRDFGKRIVEEISKGRADYLFTERFAVPLKLWTDWSILLPQYNQMTFDEVYGGDKAFLRNQDKGAGEKVLDGIKRGFLLKNPSVIKQNCHAIQQFMGNTKDMFLVEPEKVVFFCINFLAWKKIKIAVDSASFAGKIPVFSEEEMRHIAEIEKAVNENRISEAFFMAKNLFKGKFDRPKELKVSVLVVTRNRAGSLRKTLISIVNQTLKPYEIIVIDNGSTDDTEKVVSGLSRTYHEIKYAAEKKIGIPFARNRAVKESSPDTDIVAFIDDDCCAAENWLYELTLPFRYDSEIVSTGGDISFDKSDLTIGGAFYHFRKLDRYIK